MSPIARTMAFPQAPEPAAEPSSGFWGWLQELARTEGLVEVVLVLAAVGVLALIGLRLVRLLRRAESRSALQDYLLGVEQALAGDLQGAARRLEKVLAADPENHYARLLYGRVQAELGDPAEAHKHHLLLQRAFEVDSGHNDLAMARALLAAGRPAEAVEAADRAARAWPDRREAVELLFRTQLAAGLPEAAAATGQRLLALSEPEEREVVRRQAAAAAALAGENRLQAGERQAARALHERARRLDGEAPEVRMLGARLQAAERGPEAAMQAVLATGERGSTGHLPALAASGRLAAVADLPRGLLALARLLPERRWYCRRCHGELAGPVAVCRHCGAREAAASTEPELFAALDSPTRWMDEIEENEAHLRRLIQVALQESDSEQARQAAAELVELGESAVQPLLAAAFADPQREPKVVALLQAMGPAIVPALFAAGAALGERRRLALPEALGGRSPAALVGRVVQGFGREALPHFEELLVDADRDQRKVLIDFFIGLGDQEQFLRVLERFPPLEILHRLNVADSGVLRRFLAGVRKGSFVAEGLLLDPAFERDPDLVAALSSAAEPEALLDLLQRRTPSRTLVKELIGHLGRDPLAASARRLLAGFGTAAIDHMLAAFSDLDRDPAIRADLAGLLQALGAKAVAKLCQCFGPTPSSLDEELVSVLTGMGEPAVEPLVQSYTRTGLLERWSAGLVSRHTNRRVQIVRALAAIGGGAASEALGRLRASEKDPNLKLRLSQALHRAQADSGGDRKTGRRQA